MELNIVEKGKDFLELEFDEKEVALMIVGQLLEKDVDAYWYEPHPLIKGFRIHVDSTKAKADVDEAVKSLESKWGEFKKGVTSKLK